MRSTALIFGDEGDDCRDEYVPSVNRGYTATPRALHVTVRQYQPKDDF